MTTRVTSMLITSLILLVIGTGAAIASEWIPTYVLEVDDPLGYRFGKSIACAGYGEEDDHPYLIIGDPEYESGTGRVYIFSLYSGQLTHTIYARADTDMFGHSVANLGDINGDGHDDIIIGSPGDGPPNADIGATIYSGDDFSILRTFRTTDYSSVQNDSYFGWDLSPVQARSGSDMNVLIGAPAHGDDAGAAYLISTADGSMVCSETYSSANRLAGYSVLGGEFHWESDKGPGISSFVIGMPEYYGWDGKIDYMREFSCEAIDNWYGLASEKFGYSMANMGYISNLREWFAVGSPGYPRSDIEGDDHGRVTLLREIGDTWEGWELELLDRVYGGQSGANFGHEVANVGNLNDDSRVEMAVGAPYHDVYWGTDAGAVFIYEVTESGNIYSYGSVFGEAPYDHFGYSICGIGDINGDGDDDFAVGAPNAGDNGKVYVYTGKSTSWYVDYVGEDPYAEFGWAISPAGDYDGDGTPDIIVGAPDQDLFGKYYVFSGTSHILIESGGGGPGTEDLGACVAEGGKLDNDDAGDILVSDPRFDFGEDADAGIVVAVSYFNGTLWIASGEGPYDCFGWSASKLGDIDGDTYNEVIVGAPYNDAGEYNAGRAYVYSGLTGTLIPALIVTGDTPNGNVGISVSDGGVTGADDTPDYLVGEPTGAAGYGRARLYSGADGGLIHTWTGEVHLDEFGRCVYGGVDLTGDGTHDFAIGAPRNDEGGTDAGKVYVYSGVDYSLYAEFLGKEPGDLFGSRIGVAKHAFPNRSNSADLLIAAPGDGSSGRVYAYSCVTGELQYTEESFVDGEGFGSSIAGIGDIDNDSICDIAVGASLNDLGGEDAGIAYVIKGRLGGAPPEVVSTSPSQNALDVPRDVDISVTFDSTMNSSTIDSNTITVSGKLSGRHRGTIFYDPGSRTATFYPHEDFTAGDLVSVTVTTGIESTSGKQLASAYVWSFTVAADESEGSFEPMAGYDLLYYPSDHACSDLDGDGDIDIAVTYADGNVSLELNDGNGIFTTDSVYAAGSLTTQVRTEDVDNNGITDLLVGNYNSQDLWVYLGQSDGTYATPSVYSCGRPRDMDVGDLDGDGFMDVAVAGYQSFSVLMNNGDGTYATRVQYPVTASYQTGLDLADMNLDGDLDIVTSNKDTDSLYLYTNDGSGGFALEHMYATGDEPRAQAVADFDGDGDIDVAVTSWDISIWIYLNNGDGSLATPANYGTSGSVESLTASDLDGDGDIDIAAGAYSMPQIEILLNDGNGAFALDDTYAISESGVNGVVAADFDGDSRVDVAATAAAAESLDLYIFFNEAGYICGDANASEAVDIDDVVYLINFIFAGGAAPDPYESGDANCSGAVDIDDVVYLIGYIFTGGFSPCDIDGNEVPDC